jgi:hypothetical protein
MWNQRKEALAMFNICTMVRDQLNKEQAAGESIEDILKRLIGFYQVTSPVMAASLSKHGVVTQSIHLSNVLHTHIEIYLAHDEQIDFKALREYLVATWPDMDIDEAVRPSNKPVFFTHSGKEVCADPKFNVLLEKVGADYSEVSSPRFGPWSDLKFPEGADASDPVQSILAFYWGSIVISGINLDPAWQDFKVFEKWAMENGYKRFHVLQCEDAQLGYVPGNVSWQEVSRRTLDPQVHDRAEMNDYLRSRGLADVEESTITQLLTPQADEEIERKLYNYWCHIKQRPVPFHELWKYFPEFKKWSLDNGYQVGHSLVRKVELDGYKPDNCTWRVRDQVIKR